MKKLIFILIAFLFVSCIKTNDQNFPIIQSNFKSEYIGRINFQELYKITIDSTEFLLSTYTNGGESSITQIK